MTLIDRLSKLDGPDREADARVWCEVNGVVYLDHYPLMHETQVIFKEKGKRKEQVSGDTISHAAFFTASVDAAIALAKRVLPGWKRQLLEDFNGKWIARICSQRRELFSTDYLRETENGGSPNAAIALCIAILRAKEASNA